MFNGPTKDVYNFCSEIKNECPVGYNVCDHLLNIASGKELDILVKPPKPFIAGLSAGVSNKSLQNAPNTDKNSYRASTYTQIGALSHRSFLRLIRDPLLLFTHLLLSIVLGGLL